MLIWDNFAFSIIRFCNLLIYIFYINLILLLFSGMHVRTSSYARLERSPWTPSLWLVGSTRGTPRNLSWSCAAESLRLRACPSQIGMNLRPWPCSRCLSRLSERILISVFLRYKAINFRGIAGDCRYAAPSDFIRPSRPGNWTPFDSIDERGSVINDYL